jgi:hypothetical protein
MLIFYFLVQIVFFFLNKTKVCSGKKIKIIIIIVNWGFIKNNRHVNKIKKIKSVIVLKTKLKLPVKSFNDWPNLCRKKEELFSI